MSNQYGNITIKNTQIFKNDRNSSIPLFYSIYFSSITISNSVIKNNYINKKSLIFMETDSMIFINNTTITDNTGYRGSVLLIQHSTQFNSIISNSIFNNNSALYTDTIFLLQANLSVINCTFNDNKAMSSPAVHATYESNLNLTNVEFSGQLGDPAYVKIADESKGFIDSCRFYDTNSIGYGVILKIIESFVIMREAYFKNISFEQGHLVIVYES